NDSSLDITEAITVSAWVKRGLTLGTYQRIIDKRYSAYSLALWTDNKINLNIEGFDGDNNKFSILAITDNNWHHIVGTFGNSVWAIYIDGVLDNSGIDNGSINTNADNILIGAHTNGSQFFNGSIDDVRIYDYARSADEIRLDYNAGVATHLGPSGKTCSEDPAGCVDYGLVGSWGMDEGAGTTAYDSSDNSNDGTLTNGPTWTTDSSPLAGDGGSLKFDGVDDYVDIMDADSLDVTNAITIEAWAKPIGINSVGGSPEYGLSYITSFSGTDLKYESNNFSFRVGNILSSQITVWSSAKSLNEFYHIVGTYDGSLIKIYVNGLEEDSDNQTGDIKLGSLDLHIGNFAGYSNVRHFNGSIDSVRIYNRALLAEEVRYHYNKGGPVAEWKFDEGSGQTAFDGSWNNNDGTRTAGSTSGTVDSGSTATLVDSALTQADDYWNDWTVKIVTTTDSLAPQGETATITDFVATTDTLSFVALTTAVGAGDTYKLYYGDENGPTWTTGKYSSAMSFDGVDDYVDAGSDASLDITDAITVSAWVKTTDTGVWFKAIVAKYGYTSIAESWGLGYTDTNILGFYIRDSGYTQNIAAASTNEGLDGNWHHLIGTANSTVVNFYIDGVLKQSTARTAGDITNDRPVSIARHHVDSYFNGSIDDVRIYDYARTVDEIRLDYQAGVATHLGPSGKDCDEDPAGCMDYGLVGSWGMDEGTGTTAYDSSDNSNDGTLTNGPTWTTDSSPLAGGGGSLKFDGVNDYVDAGDDASLNITDEVTVEAWVYSNGTQADDYAAISGKSTSYYLNFNHTGDSLYFTITDNSINKNTIYAITHNKWVHIVGTFDSTVIKLYMDSIEVDSTDYTGDIDSNINNKIFIGAYGTTGVASNNFFNGSIDSVRIYNRALSAEEVRYHYNKGGPVAEWGFDEGSETTAFDGSWNNNDGTLTNFGTTDTGTAESGGDNTLTDSDKTWSTDQWADGTITTTGGTGLGQSRTVLSNTATIITVSSNWTTNPDATTTYSLVQAPTWTSGKYGSAIKFDGSNDYVDVGNDSSLSFSNNFTLEAWIYPKNYDGGRAIIRKDSSYVIYYSSELDFYNWADSSRLSCQKSNTPLNTWSHVVAVWDGTNKIIYVNGVVCVSAPSVNFSENSNDTHIGSNSFGSDYFFNGSIDDVRIYNYARTAEQIQMDYNAGVATHLK
ncbi:MAG: LamG domain-containing protein, partial [Candidatus Pacebacteria bacterium]|nr:LamG domain-containing protein [Candidatus Paceibacterota bacterium]